MTLKTITEQDVRDKRIVCRFDFNVPLENGVITDTKRIDVMFPTIDFLKTSGAKHITILAHLGQPSGYDPLFSLKPVAEYLAKHYGANASNQSQVGQSGLQGFTLLDWLTIMENVRFNPGEEENDPKTAEKYAELGQVYLFDGFAVAHRTHASIVAITSFLPSFAGPEIQKEVAALESLRSNPNHPFMMIIGGAKIEDKLPVIENLSSLVDRFLVGGAVANTFLKASGVDVKKSLVEEEYLDDARRILSELRERIVLPSDHVWDGDAILDIGPRTIMQFEDYLTDAKTILWNGNLGKTEDRAYSRGSLMIGDFLSRLADKTRIIAGGDTAGFLDAHHLAEKMTFVSTGGGAALEFLAGKALPALVPLEG